ncbi:MAG: zinc-ribbon domain-containing protein [Clostridia bacterium]|jgi:ribose transport system permease protein|nr:zinc-ribbon domain-containing protein [Clostridia bacterium]MBT7122957.1 zinc-ribbon domain-containing protein [Clostridia bacterium]
MERNDATNGEQNAFCWQCGTPLEADSQFCINCGAQVEETLSETAPEPPAEAAPEPPVETEPEPPVETDPKPQSEAAPVPPIYAPAEYTPGSDTPFPDAPAQAQTVGYRNETPPQKTTNVFVGGVLGLVVFAALFCVVIIVGLFSRNFLSPTNLSNVFTQFLMFGALACGVAMTSRAKGPDLSMGAVFALTGVIIASIGGSWIIGVAIALLVCASIGAINGVLIVFLRIPSLVATVVIAAILRGVVYVITNGREIMIGSELKTLARIEVAGLQIVPLAIFAVAFVAALLVILFSRLGKPLSKREVKDNRSASYFVAYLLSSIIAFLVGVYFMSRLGAAVPIAGIRYEIFILLCFAVITSSRFLDNRGIPAVFAAAVALFYVLLSNVFMIIGISPHWLAIAYACIALAFVIISYIARKDSLKGLVHRV